MISFSDSYNFYSVSFDKSIIWYNHAAEMPLFVEDLLAEHSFGWIWMRASIDWYILCSALVHQLALTESLQPIRYLNQAMLLSKRDIFYWVLIAYPSNSVAQNINVKTTQLFIQPKMAPNYKMIQQNSEI